MSRDAGFTETQWLAALPEACGAARLHLHAGHARVELPEGGALALSWQALPPRRIALLCLPRLSVRFRFEPGVSDASRQRFMRHFDRVMQRGGG